MLIDGQQADRKACSVTPLDVMCAAESDLAVVGKGFRGALDDIRFSYQETAEPQIRYTGSEPADDAPLRGDVNADGKVSVADAVMLCRYLTGEGSVTDWQAGDLNADSRLGADDLTLLKRLLLG